MVNIRKVQHGDENNLAYIQTESWKEAFKDIVPADLLSKCTGIERATAMYKKLLDENVISPKDVNRKIPNFVFETSVEKAVTEPKTDIFWNLMASRIV